MTRDSPMRSIISDALSNKMLTVVERINIHHAIIDREMHFYEWKWGTAPSSYKKFWECPGSKHAPNNGILLSSPPLPSFPIFLLFSISFISIFLPFFFKSDFCSLCNTKKPTNCQCYLYYGLLSSPLNFWWVTFFSIMYRIFPLCPGPSWCIYKARPRT